MIPARFRIAFAVVVLGCYAPAQTQTLSEPYKKWLECDISWLTSEAQVGRDFSLKVSFHGTPVVGIPISLNSVSKRRSAVATGRTNLDGVVRFEAIPPGVYDPGSPEGVLFPAGDVLIVVKAGNAPGEIVTLDWPNRSFASRALRGKFTVSEDVDGPDIPLRNTVVELRDLYSAKLIETVLTDANGEYHFTTDDPGLYAVRLVLANKDVAEFEKRDLAVELDFASKAFSIPEMNVVQSDCAGIQLFRRSTTDDRWEEQ
jgi:hypothetical protein